LGIVVALAGRNDEAAAAFRRVLEFMPGYVEAHNNLGNALRYQGQLDEAEQPRFGRRLNQTRLHFGRN